MHCSGASKPRTDLLKKEKGTKTTQQKQGGKNKYNSCSWRILELCLRRKRVKGSAYIHEWQLRAKLRDYTFPRYISSMATGL
jgi:hypothetical protein